jgi:ATP-dependent helicase/DNAse subunit B
LESSLEYIFENELLPFPIKISGKVYRIEERNNVIRIIDYKTGKVLPNKLKVNNFDGLTNDLKNEKVIQLLCYAMMLQNNEILQDKSLQAAIVSFKSMKGGFTPFGLGKGKTSETEITSETIELFKSELLHLILEILDKEIPFKEKT